MRIFANGFPLKWISLQEDPSDPLRDAITDILSVEETTTYQGGGGSVQFTGRLLQDSSSAFRLLEQRFTRLGYTPLLRKSGSQDIIIAIQGVSRPKASNALINLILFLLTVGSTIYGGILYTGGYNRQVLFIGDAASQLNTLLGGILFSGSMLAILGAHELGHYFMARRHRVDVTLPYFIPFPISLIGTLGAFIRMKSPVHNRRSLFDVAVAGPLAGLIVALPVMIVGLALSHPAFPSAAPTRSLLLSGLIQLLYPDGANVGIVMHPIAWAGFIGFLITGLNLLPAGQLDGGHITYSIFGRYSRYIAGLTVAVMLGMAVFFRQANWYIWVAFILFTGLAHPEPLDDVTPLDPRRRTLGLATLALLFVLMSPRPLG